MAGHGGYRPGSGRPKGAPNKNSQQIRDMIIGALQQVGGTEYLARQALENPSSFLTLVGKVLPMQVVGDENKPLSIRFIWDDPQPTAPLIEATSQPVAITDLMFDDAETC